MKLFKEFIDIFIIFLLLPFLFPFLTMVGIIIFIIDGSPIFYIEKRIGKDGIPFKIFKFRTMKVSQSGVIISKNSTSLLTKTGFFLRKWGIDELPQLINVIKGEMSIVGPRPVPLEHPVNKEKNNFRFKVKPGITGFAQINGRNKISWDEKLKYDKFYVEHLSPFFDLKIILKTPLVLLGESHLF